MTEVRQECTAPHCDTVLPYGVYLCVEDLTRLEAALLDVRSTLSALGAVVIRSTTYGASVGGASAGDKPVVFDETALTRGYELRELVNSWAAYLLEPLTTQWDRDTVAWMEECETIDALALAGEEAPPMPAEPARPGPIDPRSPANVAEWVATHTNTIRTSDWAGDMYDEITHAVRVCLRGSDRAATRAFAGMCPTTIDDQVCGAPLYALERTPVVKCRNCGGEYDVNGWRAAALAAAGVIEGTAAEVSRALTDPATGECLPQGTIRSWVSRGLLTPVNDYEREKATAAGDPVPAKRYRISDVQDLWLKMRASKYGNPTLRKPTTSGRVVA